jgi:nitrate reductase NapE component
MPKKIFLYNLSLLPLYIIYYIKLVDIKILDDANSTIEYMIVQESIVFLVLTIFILFGLWIFNRDLESNSDTLPIITNIERKEYDYFTFMSVFILPLFALSLDGFKDWVVLVLILSFMGLIYIRGDFLYLNPVFLLFGWYLYKGETKEGEKVFLADSNNIKNTIEKGYHYKMIDKNFIFLKRMKDGN